MQYTRPAPVILCAGLLAAASCATAPALSTQPLISRYSAQDVPTGSPVEEPVEERPNRYERNVQVMFGMVLDEPDALDPTGDMHSYGFSVDTYEEDDPFGLEVFIRRSSGSDTSAGQETMGGMTEVGFGFRRTRPIAEDWLAYLGVGFALILIERDEITAGDFEAEEDFLPGFYLHGGTYHEFESGWHVGVDARALLAEDPDFASGDGAGYVDLLGFVGVSF